MVKYSKERLLKRRSPEVGEYTHTLAHRQDEKRLKKGAEPSFVTFVVGSPQTMPKGKLLGIRHAYVPFHSPKTRKRIIENFEKALSLSPKKLVVHFRG